MEKIIASFFLIIVFLIMTIIVLPSILNPIFEETINNSTGVVKFILEVTYFLFGLSLGIFGSVLLFVNFNS